MTKSILATSVILMMLFVVSIDGKSVKKIELGPGPMKAFGKKIDNPQALTPGNPIQILWKGEWWLGSVVKVQKSGKVRVHYYGWDFNWDQDVDVSKILLVPYKPGPIQATGVQVTASTPLKLGGAVQVEWSGKWYLGTIMAFDKNGKVKIHYYGWSHSYDEIVPRERLRSVPLKKKKT